MRKILISWVAIVPLFFLSIAGCKIRIIVPEGGSVTTESGAYTCGWGEKCDIDVVDFYFDETFIAKPTGQYKFLHWSKGPNRICGAEKQECRIHSTGYDEDLDLAEATLALLESEERFYLVPVFAPINRCNDRVLGTGNVFTLREGEFTTREVHVPYLNIGAVYKTKFEGCPARVCSKRYIGRIGQIWSDAKDKFDIHELRFAPRRGDPLGTYRINYVAYSGGYNVCEYNDNTGGNSCTWVPEKIRKRWEFKMNTVECPK